MPFLSAVPIWPEHLEGELNRFVGFRTVFESRPHDSVVLWSAGSTVYRIWLNGVFVGHGPARAAHGFFRVDRWPLASKLRAGANVLAIEVAGYHVNSYALLDQPAFLQAEVRLGTAVLASTGNEASPFEAVLLGERVQRVQRYSYQRPFIEVYRLGPGSGHWKTALQSDRPVLPCRRLEARRLLPRQSEMPDFKLKHPVTYVARGATEAGHVPARPWTDRSLTEIGPLLGGFPKATLDRVISDELQSLHDTNSQALTIPVKKDEVITLADNRWRIFDFGTNLTGFPGVHIACEAATTVTLTFDEVLTDGNVDFTRLNAVNAVTYDLEPGAYTLETFEPYTLRYLKIINRGAACRLTDIHLRELACPGTEKADFSCSDPDLERLFVAARETFRQNATDIFMDCPSRERAGWLCDSFFTARVERDLLGRSGIEHDFLQNFLLPDRFDSLPDGMLPMCYPADHPEGRFIPNWAMWFVLELEEYLERSGDTAMVSAFAPRVASLLEYLARFENSDGLLESLPGWVFIEWSEANAFVQDVNYPSNMLYAGTLDAAGRLYNQSAWRKHAAQLRAVIREQAFDGECFVDNAIRKHGVLMSTRNRSETCQYYACFFDVATRETHPRLWRALLEDFGPGRAALHPEIHPSNAFIGHYLRMECLSRAGQYAKLYDELKAYFLPMARLTGTLWEHDDPSASCNHGFASHVAHLLFRDILGCRIDHRSRQVHVEPPHVPLTWCCGRLPVEGGVVRVEWGRPGSPGLVVDLPEGWTRARHRKTR